MKLINLMNGSTPTAPVDDFSGDDFSDALAAVKEKTRNILNLTDSFKIQNDTEVSLVRDATIEFGGTWAELLSYIAKNEESLVGSYQIIDVKSHMSIHTFVIS